MSSHVFESGYKVVTCAWGVRESKVYPWMKSSINLRGNVTVHAHMAITMSF